MLGVPRGSAGSWKLKGGQRVPEGPGEPSGSEWVPRVSVGSRDPRGSRASTGMLACNGFKNLISVLDFSSGSQFIQAVAQEKKSFHALFFKIDTKSGC